MTEPHIHNSTTGNVFQVIDVQGFELLGKSKQIEPGRKAKKVI